MSVYEKMTALADAIREKTGGSEPLGLDEMAEAVKGMSGDSYYDAFWDAYQQNGDRVNYHGAFSGSGWTEETFKPKYNIQPTSAYMMFYDANNLDVDLVEVCEKQGITMDFSKCTNFQYFASAGWIGQAIKRFGVLDIRASGANSSALSFSGNYVIHTIDKIIVNESSQFSVNVFGNCISLANITFEGVIGNSISFASCSKLTTASVQNIIDHLKDLTGSTAQTLTLHATVKAKLTDAQKAQITSKNWTLA